MTQQEEVLRHLKRKTITSFQAFDVYNITRLADVVFKLRNKGHKIITELLSAGNGAQYARYRLVK